MDLLDGLKAFVVTAQTGSFTEAAKQLGVSNRLTSKYVAQLEEKLGARLLQRTTRQVGLTPTGQDLLLKAPALLEELDELLESISLESKDINGLLRVAAPVTLGEQYINNMLSRFISQHPNVSIDLQLSDAHIDLAQDGIDLAFRVGLPDVASLKARKLGEFSSLLVASPEYLSHVRMPEHPDDLTEHTCIIDTNRTNARTWQFYKDKAPINFYPEKTFMVNSARVARDWAFNGHGIALCPSFVLTQDIQEKKLIPLLSQYHTQVHPFCAIYLSGHRIPRKVRALIDFAVEDFNRNTELTLNP